VRLLLDTHIALWAIAESPQLPGKAFDLISDPENDVFISAATLWEIAIKHPLKRHVAKIPVSSTDARAYFQAAAYNFLDITSAHAVAVESLPLLHADPFDRVLVAQALTEPLHLLTHDATVARYSSSFILV